jgi:putative alpha-1,2-mannosidase
VDPANLYPGELQSIGDSAVTGEEHVHDMKVHVYGESSAPVKFTASGDEKKRLVAQANTSSLEFCHGISFISNEQAKKNLQNEILAWGFKKIKVTAKDRWNKVFGQIKVKGGTEAQGRVFYTWLYLCYERRINIPEGGQHYSAYGHQVHQDSRPFYVD